MAMRPYLVRNLTSLAVPVVATAVIGATAHLYVPSVTDMAIRTDQVQLVATIDSASTAAGISDSSLYFMNQTDLNTAMQQLQTMGVTQIRVLLPWQYMEPADDSFSWKQADQLLKTAAKFGMAVEATITSTPTWATKYSAGGLISDGEPTSNADYAAFVKAVAARYGSSNNGGTGLLSAIEVWNEPNGNVGWYPTPTADKYTDLLKLAYTAIKSVAPDITVVAGALGAGVTIGTWTINPVNFLQQMYADGAEGFFDALSFHPYNYTSVFSAGTTFANSAIKQLKALRALMDSYGDAAKLIWATEYGEPSNQKGGQAQQAAYIQDFLNTWSKLAGVGPMFLYSLLPDGQGDNLNIFGSDWTPKEAVAVIEAWIAAHPPGIPPVTSIPGTVVDTLGELLSNIGKALTTAVSNVVSSLSHAVSALGSSLSNAVKSLVSNIGSAIKALLSGGSKATAAAAQKAAKAAAVTAATKTSTKNVAAESDSASAADTATSDDASAKTAKTAKHTKKAHVAAADTKSTTTDTKTVTDTKSAADTTTATDTKTGAGDSDDQQGRAHPGKDHSGDSGTDSTTNTKGTKKAGEKTHKKSPSQHSASASTPNKAGGTHNHSSDKSGRHHR